MYHLSSNVNQSSYNMPKRLQFTASLSGCLRAKTPAARMQGCSTSQLASKSAQEVIPASLFMSESPLLAAWMWTLDENFCLKNIRTLEPHIKLLALIKKELFYIIIHLKGSRSGITTEIVNSALKFSKNMITYLREMETRPFPAEFEMSGQQTTSSGLPAVRPNGVITSVREGGDELRTTLKEDILNKIK